MTNRERIGRLEALLARIQQRAAEPRERPVVVAPPPPPLPVVPEELVEEPPLTVAARVPEYRAPVEEIEESRPEAISGEFAVADVPMELEELGPADEVEVDEHVEINVDESIPRMAVAAPVQAPAPAEPEIEVEEERISEPPESGRELVATPHESARLAVAAPATPDPNALELTEEEPAPPPESSRNLRVAPSGPATSDVFDLAPPPFEPEKHVDAIRPNVPPAEVSAYEGAMRAPRPETFGVLLDAALDL